MEQLLIMKIFIIVQKVVKEKFDVELHREVRIIESIQRIATIYVDGRR